MHLAELLHFFESESGPPWRVSPAAQKACRATLPVCWCWSHPGSHPQLAKVALGLVYLHLEKLNFNEITDKPLKP